MASLRGYLVTDQMHLVDVSYKACTAALAKMKKLRLKLAVAQIMSRYSEQIDLIMIFKTGVDATRFVDTMIVPTGAVWDEDKGTFSLAHRDGDEFEYTWYCYFFDPVTDNHYPEFGRNYSATVHPLKWNGKRWICSCVYCVAAGVNQADPRDSDPMRRPIIEVSLDDDVIRESWMFGDLQRVVF